MKTTSIIIVVIWAIFTLVGRTIFKHTPKQIIPAHKMSYNKPDKLIRQVEHTKNTSPYAIFGDSSFVLMTKQERTGKHILEIPVYENEERVGTLVMDFKVGKVTSYDVKGNSLGEEVLPSEILARFSSVDPRSEKYFNLSPYNYTANNPALLIDPNGDTIRINFANSKHLLEPAYHLWASTEEGKKFHDLYDVGGKYGHNSILIQFGKPSNGASGSTRLEFVDSDGKKTRVTAGKVGKDVQDAATNGENGYLKFTMTLDRQYNPEAYNDYGTQITAGSETMEHESQHVDIDISTIVNEGRKVKSGISHGWMRNKQGSYYRDRAEMFKTLKPFWSRTYERRKSEYQWSENEFIDYFISDFQ